MDLMERIDTSFGQGPDHRPVADRLTAGRSAVRRRRRTTGVMVLATAGVVGTTGWALSGGSGGPSVLEPAGTSTTTASATTSPTPTSTPTVTADTDPKVAVAPPGTSPGCVLDLTGLPSSPPTNDAAQTPAACGSVRTPPVLLVDGTLYRASADVRVDQLVQPAGPSGDGAAAVVEVGDTTEWVFTRADQEPVTTVALPGVEGQTFAEWAANGPAIHPLPGGSVPTGN